MAYRIDRKQFYCKNCGENVIGERQVKDTNHILHFLITLFTFGIWVIVWILVAFNFQIGGYKCTKCGKGVSLPPRKESKIELDKNPNHIDQLTKLSDLLDKGLLTKEEFQIEKEKLLNK